MYRGVRVAIVALASAACSLQSGNLDESAPDTTTTPMDAPATSTTAPPASLAKAPIRACGAPAGATRKEQVCWRWQCDGTGVSNPAVPWNGSSGACRAGDLDPDVADRTLRRLNVHRFLAELPPVEEETSWRPAAQACALIAQANAKLSHNPPASWSCWSPLGAATSANSLVANRAAAGSIAAYFEDPGNEPSMVHRRWLLSESLDTVGLGSTDRYSCVVVDGHELERPSNRASAKAEKGAERTWAAWPPAGPVPFDVFTEEKLDEAGWTVQSGVLDLERATVTVTEAGEPKPVTLTHLTPLLGSRSAVRFIPKGWKTEPGHRYDVRVKSSASSIDFTVEPTTCS